MYVLCFGIEGTLHQLFADPKRMAELCLCAGTLDEKQIENRKIDTFKQSHRQRDITGPYVVDFLWYKVSSHETNSKCSIVFCRKHIKIQVNYA